MYAFFCGILCRLASDGAPGLSVRNPAEALYARLNIRKISLAGDLVLLSSVNTKIRTAHSKTPLGSGVFEC